MAAEDTELFRGTLEERGTRYGGAELRSILDTSGSGVPSYFSGTLVFQDESSKEVEESIDYESIVLRRQTLNEESAIEVVDQLMERGFAEAMMYEGDITFSDRPSRVLGPPSGWPIALGERERFTGWPERIFKLEAENPGRLRDLPMAKPHHQPLVSSETVQDYWLPGDPPRPNMANSGLYVVCPDYRVALEEIYVSGEEVIIQTKCHPEYGGDVILQIAGPGPEGLEETQPLDAEEVQIPIDHLPDELYVFLMEEESEDVLDWAKVDPYSLSQPAMIHTELPPEDAQDHIAIAENQTVELKGGITSHDDNVNDFVETVVGFSNAEGGRIYIGVNDDKDILGVTDVDKTTERVESWAHDRVEPPVQVETGSVELEGETIVVAQVPEGGNKPYRSLADEAFFMRVGEDDERITRAQMDEIYSDKQPAPGDGTAMGHQGLAR